MHLCVQLVGISVTPEDAGNFREALRNEDVTGPQGVGDLGPDEVSYYVIPCFRATVSCHRRGVGDLGADEVSSC